MKKIYYLIDNNDVILEASFSSGYWGQEGISNIDVMKHCLGLRDTRLFLGLSEVSFKFKELKNAQK
jgi:hypothetical protein